MRIRSRERRAVFLALLFGLAFDFVICAAILHFFGERGEALGTATLLFLVVQAIAIAFVVRDAVVSALWSAIAGRKIMASATLAGLEEAGYPKPPADITSSSAYFEWIEADTDLPLEVRLRAARDLGTLSAGAGGFVATIARNMAVEDALTEFRKTRN